MCNIAISNLPYIKKDLSLIMELLKKSSIKDVEIFLEPLDERYHKESLKLLEEIKEKGYSLSIHGPFRMVNLVSDEDEYSWNKTLWSFKESIDITKKYNGEFIVIHSNEAVKDRNIDKELSIKHLREIVNYAISQNVVPVIENVGVGKNNLFNQEEFLKLCEEFTMCKVLIDVGHAIINKWDLELVVSTLKDRVIAYHIHNNDGKIDLHNEINNGIYNYEEFVKIAKKFTPKSKMIFEYSYDLENKIEKDIAYFKGAMESK